MPRNQSSANAKIVPMNSLIFNVHFLSYTVKLYYRYSDASPAYFGLGRLDNAFTISRVRGIMVEFFSPAISVNV